jgi:hypothetical protein
VSAIPAPATRVRTESRHRGVRVALALGRVEARKLLRHPASIVGALLTLAVPVVASWREVPVLNRYDSLTAESLIPFGWGVLIAAHLGTMRAQRHRTTELFDSAVASRILITAGHLVTCAWAAVFASLLMLSELAYLKVIGGVTTPRLEVALAGPALIAFASAFGVALGRWAPRLFVAPLVLAGIVAICTALTTNTYAHPREFLSLWVPSEVVNGTVSEFSLRPYGWRLLYIMGLALLATAVAFAYHRRLRIVAVAVALLVATSAVFAGAHTMQEPSRATQVAAAEAAFEELRERTCREYASVRYCAFEGYESWIDRWRAPVEGVMAALPAEALPDDLLIAQLPGEGQLYDDGANNVLVHRMRREINRGSFSSLTDVNPSFSWGRGADEGRSEIALALMAATRATAIDTRFRLTEADVAGIQKPHKFELRPGRRYRYCMMLEQGRSIVALWLAAQATPRTETAFRAVYARSPYVAGPDGGGTDYFEPQFWTLDEYLYETVGRTEVSWGTREAAYAVDLMKRDEAEVRAAIAADWAHLTDPATTTDEAAAALGLAPLPPLGEAIEKRGYFKNYRGVEQFGVPQCH